MQTDDAYDKAKFYSAREAETLTCETVEEALTEWVESRVERGMTDEQVEKMVRDHGPIEVQAYDPMPVSDAWLNGQAKCLLETFAENFTEEFGDEDGRTYRKAEKVVSDAKIEAQIRHTLNLIVDGVGVYQCQSVGSRTYSADDVLAMLAFDGYFVKG